MNFCGVLNSLVGLKYHSPRASHLHYKQYKNVSLTMYEGGIPAPAAVLDKAAEESDVVVGSSSD